jgi:hypothetical protein
MAAATLNKTVRYLPPGIRQVYWVPTIANVNSPTRSELNAGTDLTGEIVDGGVSGFSTSPTTVDAPDLGSKITRKVAGRTTLDDSSLMLYADSQSNDARTLFTDGAVGNIVVFPEGDHSGGTYKMQVHPVTVLTSTIDEDTTKLGQFTVSFAASNAPVKNISIP